jgi:O-antigen ligase
MRRLIWVCCAGGVALVLTGILTGQVGGQPGAGPLADGAAGNLRFSAGSSTYDPNDLALLLVMLLPLLLYLMSTSRPLTQMLISGFMIVSLYGIVLTQSRAGFLALIGVGTLFLVRSRLSSMSKVTIALAAVVVFGMLASGAYWDRMATIGNPESELDRTGAGRTEIWKTGLVLLATHPLGLGIDGFVTAEGLYHGGIGKWSAAHNSFLQIGVELGVAGLIVFLLMIARTLQDLRTLQAKPKKITVPGDLRKQEEARGSPNLIGPLAAALEISLWGFVMGGFFLSQAYSGLLYIVLALSLACMRLANQGQISVQRPNVHKWGMKKQSYSKTPMNP